MHSALTKEERIRLRKLLFEMQGARCVYCSAEMDSAICTLDHVRSLSAGGTDDMSNLIVCCLECNQAKRNASAETFMPELADDIEANRRFAREKARMGIEKRFTNRPLAGLAALLAS